MKKFVLSISILMLSMLLFMTTSYATGDTILVQFTGSETTHSIVDYEPDFTLTIDGDPVLIDGEYQEDSLWTIKYLNSNNYIFYAELKTKVVSRILCK